MRREGLIETTEGKLLKEVFRSYELCTAKFLKQLAKGRYTLSHFYRIKLNSDRTDSSSSLAKKT